MLLAKSSQIQLFQCSIGFNRQSQEWSIPNKYRNIALQKKFFERRLYILILIPSFKN